MQNELAMITSSSLSETIEGLSLGYRKGSARKEEEGMTIEKLLNEMQELLTLTDSDKIKELSLKKQRVAGTTRSYFGDVWQHAKGGNCCANIFFITI